MRNKTLLKAFKEAILEYPAIKKRQCGPIVDEKQPGWRVKPIVSTVGSLEVRGLGLCNSQSLD